MRLNRAYLALIAASSVTSAQGIDSQQSVVIYDTSDKYSYYGCYNETTGIADSAGTRALDGASEVKRGEMTVPMCLEFCGNGDTEYRYAGLEWSRECWCGQALAGISKKLDDNQCNYPCEGNETMACGGALKLTVYRLSAAPPRVSASGLLALTALVTICLW